MQTYIGRNFKVSTRNVKHNTVPLPLNILVYCSIKEYTHFQFVSKAFGSIINKQPQ